MCNRTISILGRNSSPSGQGVHRQNKKAYTEKLQNLSLPSLPQKHKGNATPQSRVLFEKLRPSSKSPVCYGISQTTSLVLTVSIWYLPISQAGEPPCVGCRDYPSYLDAVNSTRNAWNLIKIPRDHIVTSHVLLVI